MKNALLFLLIIVIVLLFISHPGMGDDTDNESLEYFTGESGEEEDSSGTGPGEDDDDEEETPIEYYIGECDALEEEIYEEVVFSRSSTNQVTAEDGSPICGDPVKIATGCLVTRETDVSIPFDGLEFKIERIYQSDRNWAHGFGPGWTFSYETRIVRGIRPDAEKVVKRPMYVRFLGDHCAGMIEQL